MKADSEAGKLPSPSPDPEVKVQLEDDDALQERRRLAEQQRRRLYQKRAVEWILNSPDPVANPFWVFNVAPKEATDEGIRKTCKNFFSLVHPDKSSKGDDQLRATEAFKKVKASKDACVQHIASKSHLAFHYGRPFSQFVFPAPAKPPPAVSTVGTRILSPPQFHHDPFEASKIISCTVRFFPPESAHRVQVFITRRSFLYREPLPSSTTPPPDSDVLTTLEWTRASPDSSAVPPPASSRRREPVSVHAQHALIERGTPKSECQSHFVGLRAFSVDPMVPPTQLVWRQMLVRAVNKLWLKSADFDTLVAIADKLGDAIPANVVRNKKTLAQAIQDVLEL